MLATLIIIFREVIEAGLIVGIVLAATKGVPGRSLWVALGVLGGVIGAAILAVFAGGLSSLFQGSGQELFNATVLLIAVCMLTWHNIWMASHGREISQQMKAVGADVKIGAKSLAALAIVVGIAVLREGSEVVLFLYGILAQGGTSAAGMATGGVLGVLAGAAFSAVIYLGLVAIPMKRLFAVTGALIALLAAGLAVQAMAFLQQAGVVRLFEKPLWNTSGVVSDGSMVGRLLKTLIGYTDQPDGLQLIAWVAVIAAMFGLTKLVGRRRNRPRRRPLRAATSLHQAEVRDKSAPRQMAARIAPRPGMDRHPRQPWSRSTRMLLAHAAQRIEQLEPFRPQNPAIGQQISLLDAQKPGLSTPWRLYRPRPGLDVQLQELPSIRSKPARDFQKFLGNAR